MLKNPKAIVWMLKLQLESADLMAKDALDDKFMGEAIFKDCSHRYPMETLGPQLCLRCGKEGVLPLSTKPKKS